MKILLVGNHTCGNRGDGAILRGLINALRTLEPSLEIDAITRYPTSSSFLLGEKLKTDLLHQYHNKSRGRLDRLWKRVSHKVLPQILALKLKGLWPFELPDHCQSHLKSLEKYDAVIQVGGSFFVDLYGEAQFEHALCALIAKKPLYMLGHSVGPFERKPFNYLAKMVFERTEMLALREGISGILMEEANIAMDRVYTGADTAWLVPTTHSDVPLALEKIISQGDTIAITFRELAPFDKRLGVSQQQYEDAFCKFINLLNSEGYRVIAFSTCTGIDSYHKDDRMVALRVGSKLNTPEMYHVVMDELNDAQLGTLLKQCILTVGTRLHSAIISMNFSTPAIALNYEHKSEGIMAQVGLNSFSQPVSSLFDGKLAKEVLNYLKEKETRKSEVATLVEEEQARALLMVKDALSSIREKTA